ncbi:MAG TPA: hypothetical protein VHX18_11910 [Rhizomicrobium sp.]|nr:hypothetical protein [Rhizomicrobium sp.]
MWLAGLGLAAASAAPAAAQVFQPLSWPVGDAQLRLGGEAGGALFNPNQPGWSGAQASGDVRLMPELRRDYDSGLGLDLGGTFAAEDPLSRGRYDGDVIERLAGEARTGLGKLEIGITDGAGYDLAVSGPKVDPAVSLDDPRTSFYRDPGSHRAVTDIFALRTQVGASSNYAKFAYSSPSLFGVQIALSFTPTEAKELPFLNAGPHLPGRQVDIWEGAVRYETDLGPASLSAYGAFAEGRAEHKGPGQEGVSDLGAGVKADYPLNDDITLSLGGSWRQSNAHAFDVNQSFQGGTTRAGHVSTGVSYRQWMAGLEYGNGVADAVPGAPRLAQNGLEASLGYSVSSSASISSGWQHLVYTRNSGLFFNGLPQLKLDAFYLHVNLKTSEQ